MAQRVAYSRHSTKWWFISLQFLCVCPIIYSSFCPLLPCSLNDVPAFLLPVQALIARPLCARCPSSMKPLPIAPALIDVPFTEPLLFQFGC